MPSPFPGMDPYLEAHWRDVHASLVVYTSGALQSRLPASLRARIDERILLGTEEGDSEQFESPTETFLEIIDHESGNRVVTIIEFLSPSNKSPGRNQEQYLRKQMELCYSDTNLVEIDLNRFGGHTLAFPPNQLPPKARTPYMVCVRRVTRVGWAEVYPLPLKERLPAIKIPLRPDDADVPLNLQALVEQCYRNGGYEGTLNYAIDPNSPLLNADKKWADKHLARMGLRPRNKPARRKGKPRTR